MQRDGNSGRNQKLMLKIKNTVTEVKNAFWLISRLDWAKDTVCEPATMSLETSQTEKQREKRMREVEQNKNCRTVTKDLIYR